MDIVLHIQCYETKLKRLYADNQVTYNSEFIGMVGFYAGDV